MSDLPVVIHPMRVPDDYLTPLHGIAEIIQPENPQRPFSPDELFQLAETHRAAGLIVPGEYAVTRATLERLPDLKIIANTAVGFDNLPLPLLDEAGIWGTNTPEAFIHATADATLALLLAIARHIPRADQFVRSGNWPKAGIGQTAWEGMELRGKTLGIVGFGNIGEAVAQRAEAFGMSILFTRRTQSEDPRQRRFEEVIAESDVVSLHTPLTAETHHLINEHTLNGMKPGAILLNFARGKVVDEAALTRALKEGKLGGAGLDVFEDEPNVHPELLTLENVVFAPHIGGATREGRKNARLAAAENVAQVLRGERPPNALNSPSGIGGS